MLTYACARSGRNRKTSLLERLSPFGPAGAGVPTNMKRYAYTHIHPLSSIC